MKTHSLTYLKNLLSAENKCSIEGIVEHTKKLGAEFGKNSLDESTLDKRRRYIPIIIAGLSIILSLRVSNLLNFVSEQKKWVVNQNEEQSKIFLKPHHIQIMGVLVLLGLSSPDQGIQNHLAEIKTGQKGKLLGFDVAGRIS